MKLFSLEVILCVSQVTFNEKIIFFFDCYLNHVLLNSDICPRVSHTISAA